MSEKADYERQVWQARAACRRLDAVDAYTLFFPPDAGRAVYREARKLCGDCPVRGECLDAALREEDSTRYRYGMRGGLTPRERSQLARLPRRVCVTCGTEFQSSRDRRCCSPACDRERLVLYMRAYQRERRNSGRANPIPHGGAHGGAHMAFDVICKCRACTGRRRTQQRSLRLRTRIAAETGEQVAQQPERASYE